MPLYEFVCQECHKEFETLVFGAGLVVNIREGVPGRMVLGRLSKTSRGAWVLLPHNEEDEQLADRHTLEEIA